MVVATGAWYNAAMASAPADTPPDGISRQHLTFLDGLRGLTALFVVFCHSDPVVKSAEGVPHTLMYLLALSGFGHYAVAVFIVLSGYCLMLPVMSTPDGRLRGGDWEYLKRRARRILPPYYLMLVLALSLCSIPLYHLRDGSLTGLATDAMFPAFGKKNILAHLLLLHNLNPEYVTRIDPPLWSVAPEWQIYFLLPTFLLPIWRRFGITAVVAAAFALGMIPRFFLPGVGYLDWTCPWYLGLFSLGMAGAAISHEARTGLYKLPGWLYEPLFWLGLLVVSFGSLFAICHYAFAWQISNYWITDPLTGVAAISLITWCVLSRQRQRPTIASRLLEWRPIVQLGVFSYSLYLTHYPILGLMNQVLLRLHPTPMQRILCVYLVFFPLTIGFAYLFFLCCERPFLTRPKSPPPAPVPVLA